RGPLGLREAEVVQALRLSPRQREQARQVFREIEQEMRQARAPGEPPSLTALCYRQGSDERFQVLLSAEQKAGWQELPGPSFRGPSFGGRLYLGPPPAGPTP